MIIMKFIAEDKKLSNTRSLCHEAMLMSENFVADTRINMIEKDSFKNQRYSRQEADWSKVLNLINGSSFVKWGDISAFPDRGPNTSC